MLWIFYEFQRVLTSYSLMLKLSRLNITYINTIRAGLRFNIR